MLYVNDSRQYLIRAFDVQADGIGRQRASFSTRSKAARKAIADGMKVDVEARLLLGPRGIHVIDAGASARAPRIPGHVTNMGWATTTGARSNPRRAHRLSPRVNVPGVAVAQGAQ